jgi:5-methylcytosine-specific restriction endonuclease McrA
LVKLVSSLTYYYVIVRAFYQGKCQRCGRIAPLENIKRSFGIHHKDGNKNNNSLENLELLCRKCHSKDHPQNTERLKDKRIIAKRGFCKVSVG